MMQISMGVSNSTVLMKLVRQSADHRRRQEGDQDAKHETPRPWARRQVRRQPPEGASA